MAYVATPHQLHCCPAAAVLELDATLTAELDAFDEILLEAIEMTDEEIADELLDEITELAELMTDDILEDVTESQAPTKVHSCH